MDRSLRIVLWNIHRGKEHAGRQPSFLDALKAFGPIDILCLVEADRDWPSCRGFLDLAAIARETGLRRPDGHPRTGDVSDGFLGLLCLVSPRVSIVSSSAFDLPSFREPRGLVIQEVDTPGGRFCLGLTHLSLELGLRCFQARAVRRILGAKSDGERVVLAGDFNEWAPFSPALRVFSAECRQLRRPSFPAALPLLHLDRIIAWPGVSLTPEPIRRGDFAHLSDHLPLVGRLTLRAPFPASPMPRAV